LLLGWRFVGGSSSFFVSPAATLGGGATIPLIRPPLSKKSVTIAAEDEGEDDGFSLSLPTANRFYMNANVAANIGLAALPEATDGQGEDLVTAVPALGMAGIEMGGRSWPAAVGRPQRLAFGLAIVGGALIGTGDSQTSFLIGFQPSLEVQF
jgi:hypothetical protein